MRFFLLVLKARKINKKLKRYERAKANAIRISEGKKPRYTLVDRYHNFWTRCRRRISHCFARTCMLSPENRFQRFWIKLKMDGTFENYVAKSILGFFGGMILTYVFFIVFIIQMQFSVAAATSWCILLGIILTLGLAFSHTVRVVVFLLLPQFFSKRGRQALMAYAFVLALTGPAKNALRNTEIMSESLACGQEQVKEAVRQIIDAIKKPFIAIKDAFRKVMKFIKQIVKKIKAIFVAIKRITLSILRVMKSIFQWLGSIVNICNKKVGTPFQRCQRAFEGAVADCQAKMGPMFSWLCSIAYVTSIVCYIVKILDFICMLLDFINDSIVGVVKRKIKEFVKHIQNIFYVSVDFKHSYKFETRQNVSMKQIAAGILTEIRTRADWFLACFDIMSLAFSCMFLLLLFKVIQYRWKFLTSDKFDNGYITSDFRDIDLRRAKNDLETLLPLNRRERNQYIKAKTLRLVKAEKVKLVKSAMFVWATTLKLSILLIADYCLYWVLDLIHTHGRLQTNVQAPRIAEINVKGDGILADLYRSVDKAFKPLGVRMEVDTVSCLPEPIPPDYVRYIQIGSTVVLCWVLAILEPYGLRMRHIVMCYYYPDRAKQRAIWLYNHILRTRGTFLKYARRQLRRNFGKNKDGAIELVSIMDRIRALCPLLNLILGKSKQEACLLCGKVARESKKEHLIKCPTPKCPGQFCTSCYADLMNVCPICKKPIEYGDLSDESLEHDSSEDDNQDKKKPPRKKGFEPDHQSRNRSSSETSYSYQDDDDNDPNVNKPPLETRPPFRDVESQTLREPVTTLIFNVSLNSGPQGEGLEEIYKRPKKMRKKHKLRRTFPYEPSMKQRDQRIGEETQKLLGIHSYDSNSETATSSLETDSESSDYASVSSYGSQEYTCSADDSLLEISVTRDQLKTRSQPSVTQRSVHTVTNPKSQPVLVTPHYNNNHEVYNKKFLTEVSPGSNKKYQSEHGKEMKSTISNMESVSQINIDVQEQNKRVNLPDRSESSIQRPKVVQWMIEDNQTSSEQTLAETGISLSQPDQLSGSESESPVSSWKSYQNMSDSSTSQRTSTTSEKDTSSISDKKGPASTTEVDSSKSGKETNTNTSRREISSLISQKDKDLHPPFPTFEYEDAKCTSKDQKPKNRWTESDRLKEERSHVTLLGSTHDDSSTWSEMSSDPMPSGEEMEQCRIKPESRVKKKKIRSTLRSHILDALKNLVNWKGKPNANRYKKIIQDSNTSVVKYSKNPSSKPDTFQSDIVEVESISSINSNDSPKLTNTRTPSDSVVRVQHDYEDEDTDDLEEMEMKLLISKSSRFYEKNKYIELKTSSVDSIQIDDTSFTAVDDTSNRTHSSNILLHPPSDTSVPPSPPNMELLPRITQHSPLNVQEMSQRDEIRGSSLHRNDEIEQTSSKYSDNFKNEAQVVNNTDDSPTNLLRQSPVPGERPLYGFDTLSYQGHRSYFSLINELEDELKRRNVKKPVQTGKTPPDLIQSGVRNQEEKSETSTSSRPSSLYEFRLSPSLSMLPPDIVPRPSKRSTVSQRYPISNTTRPFISHQNQAQEQCQHNMSSSQYGLPESSGQMTQQSFPGENSRETSSRFDNRMIHNAPTDGSNRWQEPPANLQKTQQKLVPDSPIAQSSYREHPLSTCPHNRVESDRFQNASSKYHNNILTSQPFLTNNEYQNEVTRRRSESQHMRFQDDHQGKHFHHTESATPTSSFTGRSGPMGQKHMEQRKIFNFPPYSHRKRTEVQQEAISSTRHNFVRDKILRFENQEDNKREQDISTIRNTKFPLQFNKEITPNNQVHFLEWRDQEIEIQENRPSSESVLATSSTSSVEGKTQKSQELFLKRKIRRQQVANRSDTKYFYHIGTISEEDEVEDTDQGKDD